MILYKDKKGNYYASNKETAKKIDIKNVDEGIIRSTKSYPDFTGPYSPVDLDVDIFVKKEKFIDDSGVDMREFYKEEKEYDGYFLKIKDHNNEIITPREFIAYSFLEVQEKTNIKKFLKRVSDSCVMLTMKQTSYYRKDDFGVQSKNIVKKELFEIKEYLCSLIEQNRNKKTKKLDLLLSTRISMIKCSFKISKDKLVITKILETFPEYDI